MVSVKECKRLQINIDSDIDMVTEVAEKVTNFISVQEKEETFFIVYELLANAIEHGNKGKQCKKVKIDVTKTDTIYKFSVLDEGEGFNWRPQIEKPIDLDGYSDRGRGVSMVKMMCDYFYYNKLGNQATVINAYR